MRTLAICLSLLIFFSACKRHSKPVSEEYDDAKLKRFLIKESAIQNTDLDSTFIVFLQSVDCICTESHIAFAVKLFNSPKYRNFKKILMVPAKNHKIFMKTLPRDMVCLFDENSKFERNGIISTTDRMLMYDKRQLALNIDLHNETDLTDIEEYLGL